MKGWNNRSHNVIDKEGGREERGGWWDGRGVLFGVIEISLNTFPIIFHDIIDCKTTFCKHFINDDCLCGRKRFSENLLPSSGCMLQALKIVF